MNLTLFSDWVQATKGAAGIEVYQVHLGSVMDKLLPKLDLIVRDPTGRVRHHTVHVDDYQVWKQTLDFPPVEYRRGDGEPELKQYLLFMGEADYPEGGWEDYVCDGDSVKELVLAVANSDHGGESTWWHIVDTHQQPPSVVLKKGESE